MEASTLHFDSAYWHKDYQ